MTAAPTSTNHPATVAQWSTPAPVNQALALVNAALRPTGFEIVVAEADLDAGTCRVEAKSHRGDTAGMMLTLHADRTANGTRASITRERVSMERVQVGAGGGRGRAYSIERPVTQFIGRQRYEGVRNAMRGLAHYIGDNSPVAIEGRPIARAALRAMLSNMPALTDATATHRAP